MQPKLILRQNGVSHMESMAAVQYAMVNDIQTRKVDIENLKEHLEGLKDGSTLPLGSVEFIREVFALIGKNEPPNISYPDCLSSWLNRAVTETTLDHIHGEVFVKPLATKCFTGFVFNSQNPSESAIEQKDTIAALPGSTPVWVSDPVSFVSEWRFYIENNQVLGHGRYDDGPDDATMPSLMDVHEMVLQFSKHTAPSAYSIDVGILDNGKTTLVECNDAWALGLYKGTMTPKKYMDMLTTRWSEIVSSVTPSEHISPGM